MVDDIDNNYTWGIPWTISVILRLTKLTFFSEINSKAHWTLHLCIYFDYLFISNRGWKFFSLKKVHEYIRLIFFQNRVFLLLIISWLWKKRISIVVQTHYFLCLHFVICMISCFVLINFPCNYLCVFYVEYSHTNSR